MKQKLISLFVVFFTPFFALAADPHSYAQPERIQVKNIDLDLNVDLEKQILGGTATLTFERTDPTANLILDNNGLKIESVQLQENKKWIDAKYTLGKADEILGTKFEIEIPAKSKSKVVRIKYMASPDAAGLQWNTAQQTGSNRPFLISNSEPINSRTWFPCQDTPVVRTTYSAKIHVAQTDLMAVMSTNNPTKTDSKGEYKFKMEIPVPSYLIALAVGRLEFKSTGPRTGIYAEPHIVDNAAAEFSDTERMLVVTESLYGKYAWGRYDLLILPASYPWGGMENPRLTFVSPTLITGKKDLVDVVAHEIAHSWSGNLVTNASWDDLWINEGFTTYVQFRIIEKLHDTATRMRDMNLDKKTLENALEDKESLQPEDTKLRTNYAGRSPDDAFTDIPYIKGSLFLYAIEEKVGAARFDAFLKSYFEKYSFKSVSTDQVITELSKIVDEKMVREWIDSPGLPKNLPTIHSPIIDDIDMMVKTFKLTGGAPGKADIARMTSKDVCYYLESLPRKPSVYKLGHLDFTFNFSGTKDPEVRTLWYKLALPRNYKPALESAPQFLASVGRGKFVVPTYAAMIKSKNGYKLAQSVYEKNKTFYSSNVRDQIEKKIYPKGKDKKQSR